MIPSLVSFVLAVAPTAEQPSAPPPPPPEGVVVKAPDHDDDGDYGPFFHAEAPSDTAFATPARPPAAPWLSIGQGAFCFVDGTFCRASLLVDTTVAAGLRAPASDEGPDVPYAHFGVRGGLVVRPVMVRRRAWHPWGVGVVGGWTLGTGAIALAANDDELTSSASTRAPALRFALINQLWLNQKAHAPHLDFSLGAVRSPVLTSGVVLTGTHAELAFGWGGWGSLYAAGDFLDRDTRISFGVRAHGIAAAPLVALAVLGAALGGAL